MDYVLEHLAVWTLVGGHLFFGGAFIICAVTAFVKDKRRIGLQTFVWLLAGTALIVGVLLYSLGLVNRFWLYYDFTAIVGLQYTLEGMGILPITLTRGTGRWLTAVLGIVMLLAVLGGLLSGVSG